MERDKSGDRPALMYEMAGKETSILQQIGFLDENNVPIQISLDYAIELGWVDSKEIKRESVPLEGFWKTLYKKG